MRNSSATQTSQATLLSQPLSIAGLQPDVRDGLIISIQKIDDVLVVISRYCDDIWWFTNAPTNVKSSSRKVDFTKIPTRFRAIIKETTYRYMHRGRAGNKPPKYAAVIQHVRYIYHFIKYLESIGVLRLAEVSQTTCAHFTHVCKQICKTPGQFCDRLYAVEVLHEMSQHTADAIPQKPWPESSAHHISGYNKFRREGQRKTPLIPDDEFSRLFQRAWVIVLKAEELLDLRDIIDNVALRAGSLSRPAVNLHQNAALKAKGWDHGILKLQVQLLEIRTACYIVIASLSGCRNHELAYIQTGSCYSTEAQTGEKYWWMRSKSTKTDEGPTEWLIPAAASQAIKVMERWAEPYQRLLENQIDAYRRKDPLDPRIAEASEHLNAVFLGASRHMGNAVRTLSLDRWNDELKKFKRSCGMKGELRSHQFRRTFANYAARSQFGDLRYLKEHFKHRSMDMTLSYALNESQEMELYLEIQNELDDIKEGVASKWLTPDTRLAGGYGKNIAEWRNREEPVVIFANMAAAVKAISKSTAIRSNGHAWCTSDNHDCAGNDLDPLRCGDDCPNAVIGEEHAYIYQRQYDDLKDLGMRDDIGPGGRERVKRDLHRCREVLSQLGFEAAV